MAFLRQIYWKAGDKHFLQYKSFESNHVHDLNRWRLDVRFTYSRALCGAAPEYLPKGSRRHFLTVRIVLVETPINFKALAFGRSDKAFSEPLVALLAQKFTEKLNANIF